MISRPMKTLSATFETLSDPSLHDGEDAVEDGAFGDEFVLAPVQADEAVLAVDIEALIGGNDLGGVDLRDLVVAGAALDPFAIFCLEHLEPRNGVTGQILEVRLGLFDPLLDLLHRLFGLEAIVRGDALDPDLRQPDDVLVG